ncbi:MAG: hypothetical protein P0Y55_02110 [Candidatus Cohnella colombiensis]|uniref:Chemotaxis protein CheX n=1 Tax=Candidatus Cohnella colombiensis TaxID=3121368 RepID=A0AA95EWU3_9BACL|nr:MAG: hypothetical protein P0Y55_02110 [Cohnella sp.]
MFARYFGQFLLVEGYVNAVELEHAFQHQAETRVKLGVLAINRGFMSADQVQEVHSSQTRLDKRFGEIAVSLQYLSEAQVDSLLSSQSTAHLSLGQALIDQGSLSFDTFGAALEQYKEKQGLSDEQFEQIAKGGIEPLLAAVLLQDDLTSKHPVGSYINLFAKNMIRFIESHIRLERISLEEAGTYDWVAHQSIQSGDRSKSRITAIAGSEAAFLELASRYALEPVDAPDEMMKASVGEFLNLHNGIYLVNRSNEGVELDLAPQSVIHGNTFLARTEIQAIIRVYSPTFSFDLLISDLSDLS